MALFPSTVAPQVLRGVVVDDETRSPMPAALVVLVDSAGRDRQRYLSGQSGSFHFDVPGPGAYALRVERLGAETNRLDGLRLAATDTLTVRVPLTVRPVALAGIEVEGESRCELARDAGAQTQQVWEEARRALATASLADSLGAYRYTVVKYSRELEPRTLAVRRSTESRDRTWSRRPIVSHPVEVLVDSGFVVRDERGGDRYYAPDADALLSEPFLDTHCFGLRAGTGDEEGLIGLEFRPLRRGSGVPDIEGVLWLDREDSGLRWLEFDYTRLPGPAGDVHTDDVGGRVEFRKLPGGGWIISRWYIRMPVAEIVREPLIGWRVRLAAIFEEGGRVVRARRPGAPGIAFAEDAGTIVGEVAGEGDADAWTGGSVRVVGTGARSEVDAQGRFRIDGVAEGRYQLAFVRPELRGLDEGYPVAEVEVARGGSSRVIVEPPPYEDVLSAACGLEDWSPGAAVLLGEVVDASTGVAATDVEVSVAWRSYRTVDLEQGRFEGVERTQAGWTDDRGAFRICGVPRGTLLTLTAELDGRGSYERSVRILEQQPVASVVLDGTGPSPARRAETRSFGRDAGSKGRLIGIVVDGQSGEPLSGAVVRLPELSLASVTGDGGRFELPAVPPGRHRVEFSYLGYATLRDTVAVEAGFTSAARARLAVEAIALEPVEVTVERREVALEVAGFYERMDEGWGRFIDLEEIEERNPSEMTDLFSGMLGATLVGDCLNPLERYVVLRGGQGAGRCFRPGSDHCFPMVVVDGTVVHSKPEGPARIDHLINSSAVAGIEVYPSSAGVPPQYAGTGSSCGVILIWSRR